VQRAPQDCGDGLAEEMDHFAPMFNGKVKTRTLAKTAMMRHPKALHQSTCQSATRLLCWTRGTLLLLPVPVTVKLTPLLGIPPTVTTTFPVVAPLGTGAAMLVGLQFVGVAAAPLNATILVPCVGPNPAPEIVIEVPAVPDVGVKLVIIGVTAKLRPLLGCPATVT